MTQAKRLEALKVETGGKTIETLPIVETGARQVGKLAPNDKAEAAE